VLRAGQCGQPDSIDAFLALATSPMSSSNSPRSLSSPDTASERAGAARTTGFGPTWFGSTGSAEVSVFAPASVFDVCHVGVVLRALLFVHCVLAIGVLFFANSWQSWQMQFTAGSASALPAVLMGLVIACALKRVFGALPLVGQWCVALALGAASGAGGAVITATVVGIWPAASSWFAPAAAGAAIAGVMFQWLRLRSLATLPAEATARLAELQSRIRPHFLFNTLNTALTLVRLDPVRAESVLEDLAELFRVAISDSSDSATLADEVALAQRYLAIEQIRFGDRLRVVWELDAAAGAARMPPLLLQPLVENAVRHGIEPSAEGGAIRVRTRVKNGRALVSIVNSIPREASEPGSGMALRNVRERLRLMHDVSAQFEAERDKAVFRVKIVVPL
jgi:two-component system sensor histidine kinase AlgZ